MRPDCDVVSRIRSDYTIGYTPIKQSLDGTYRSTTLSVQGQSV